MSPSPAPTEQTRATLQRPFRLLIDGAWTDADSGETLDVFNPADGRVIVAHLGNGASMAAIKSGMDSIGPGR